MKEYNKKSQQDIFHAPQEGSIGYHDDPVLPIPQLGERIILTKTQFDNYIGCLVDITSKKGKTISDQSKLATWMRKTLNDFCLASNGGRIATEINQYAICKKTKLSRDTLHRILKNLIHYQIIKKYFNHSKGNNATFYIGGDILLELLDPKILEKKDALRNINKLKLKFSSLGHNPDSVKTCECCRESKKVIFFGIDDKSNRVVPVCMSCINKHKKGQDVHGYKSAWRQFYMENQSETFKSFEDYEKNEMENISIEQQTIRLLEEYGD